MARIELAMEFDGTEEELRQLVADETNKWLTDAMKPEHVHAVDVMGMLAGGQLDRKNPRVMCVEWSE